MQISNLEHLQIANLEEVKGGSLIGPYAKKGSLFFPGHGIGFQPWLPQPNINKHLTSIKVLNVKVDQDATTVFGNGGATNVSNLTVGQNG